MNFFNNKRAEAITIVLVVIIIVMAFSLGLFVNFGHKECRANTDCGNDFYCGSDFVCHQIPTIEKTIVKNNLIVPSIIIGIAIVIAAIVLKSRRIQFSKSNEAPSEEKTYKNPLKLP